ncbi:hypothetical protein OROGR_006202 [Orobanche gracilis]
MKNNHEIVTVNLPIEIITEILLRLPAKSLVRYTCVSKSWLFLISRSYKFAKAHVKILIEKNAGIHQKLIFGSRNLPLDMYTCSIQSIINVCNLVVYPTTNDCSLFDRVVFDHPFAETVPRISLVGSCNGLVMWNPTTRKSKELPNSDVDMIFSLGTNSWKTLSSNWSAVHWSVCDFNKPVEWVIVSLDLDTKTFTELSVPKLDHYYITLEVRILQGCLALYREHTVYMDVWVMKEYGVTESWNKVFRIPIPPDFSDIHRFVRPRPLYLWADGKILMDYGSSLKMYDSTNPRPHHFDSHSILAAITYVETIVPLTFDDEEFNNS